MTTLVGLHLAGSGTWIGSDSQITSEVIKTGPIRKWTLHQGWAIGCAGNLRTLTLLEAESEAVMGNARTVQQIVQRLERMMADHNYVTATDGPFGAPAWGQSFLVAHETGLWDIDVSLGIIPIAAGTLWAAGSGREFALGAGHACRDEADPARRVQTAIQAACAFDPASGYDVYVNHIKPRHSKPPSKKIIAGRKTAL